MHRIAVGIAPDHPVLLDNLGMVYLDEFLKTRNGEYLDQAESSFRASMAADPDLETAGNHLEKTLIQRLSGNVEQDREIHAQIIETDRYLLRINPFNPFVRKNLAEALYNTGARDEAVNELLLAIRIEPNYVPAYLRLAEWRADEGRQAEGEQFLQQALSVVTRYRDNTSLPVYEAVLLGRPPNSVIQ
jgi:tetratricopeptide (TPR) repeat protein